MTTYYTTAQPQPPPKPPPKSYGPYSSPYVPPPQQPPYAPQYPSSAMEKPQQQQYPQQAYQSPDSPQYPASAMEKPQQAPLTPVHTQPQPIQTMAVGGGGNRNIKNLPVGPKGREWSHGLFDCCDEPGTCLLAWFCSCVVYAQIKHRVEHLDQKGKPDPEAGGGFCSLYCVDHWSMNVLAGLGPYLQASTRSTIRSRYSIEGGRCSDAMTALCCTACELTQESREIQLEEDSFGGQRTI